MYLVPLMTGGKRTWRRALVGLFVAYHASLLVVHNLPANEATRALRVFFGDRLAGAKYLRLTGSEQTWSMFAPNPVRENVFVRVTVEDATGRVHDLGHDIRGRRNHPYLRYSHLAKVNQRLADSRSLRNVYSAWVCRSWQLEHPDLPARTVRMTRLSTRVPPPTAARDGFDPGSLPVKREILQTVSCAKTPLAQVPPEILARHGRGPDPDRPFVPRRSRTWATP